MHLRNFGNHVTVRAPLAPQGNQCEMTFFTLCGGYNLLFYQMMDVHVMVILATRTLRERKKTQSRVFFRLNFYVYSDVDNRERARARIKKKEFFENVRHVHRRRVVPHFSFKDSRASDKRARVEITPREKGDTR